MLLSWAVYFGPSACLRNAHPSLKVSRKLHWVFLTYISGPMEEGRPGTPTRGPDTPGSRTYVEARDRWLVNPIRTTRKDWSEPVRL
jgi:hypothetical protein